MLCPKCKSGGFIQYIHHSNVHTENESDECYYYYCKHCQIYIRYVRTTKTEYSETSFLSNTLA